MNYQYKVGPSKSLKVYPGDKIDISVVEYHRATANYGTTTSPLATLITNVAAAFGGVSGAPGVEGSIYAGVNTAVTAFGTGGNQGDSRPAAYLNYILFDKNFKLLDAGWQLAPAAAFTKHTLAFPTKLIEEEGYLFTWLSYDNESANFVYFDDYKVTHTKTNVIQYNEYYPFGLQTTTSWTRENEKDNVYLNNGGSELNTATFQYEMHFRNYDPVLGRMTAVDPMASKYSGLNLYNYAFNNPVSFNDVTGADPLFEGWIIEYDEGNGFAFLTHDDGRRITNYFGPAAERLAKLHAIGAHWSFGLSDYSLILRSGNQMLAFKEQIRQKEKKARDLIDEARRGNVAALEEFAETYGEDFVEGYWVNSDGNTFFYFDRSWENDFPTGNGTMVGLEVHRFKQAQQGGPGDPKCPNCVNPATLNHNLLWLSYPGGDNPMTYAGEYSYSHVPKRLSEYPAIGHDRRYDKLGTAGLKGLITDTRAIGADWRFVGEELNIAANQFVNPIDRMQAGVLGVGLGFLASFKTVYQMMQGPQGGTEVMVWYHISNQGVNNTPSIHKH